MRLINRLRLTYSIIFLVIGLIIGYGFGVGTVLNEISNIFTTEELEALSEEEKEEDEEVMSEVEDVIQSEVNGFATITSSTDGENDLVVLGFEGLEPLGNDFYEGWIVEFKEGEAVAKISTGKFNINEDGAIVDTEGSVINNVDPTTAEFTQSGSNDDVVFPVDILDPNREFRIVITIEPGDEALDEFNPSSEVVLEGVVNSTIVVLLAPQ